MRGEPLPLIGPKIIKPDLNFDFPEGGFEGHWWWEGGLSPGIGGE